MKPENTMSKWSHLPNAVYIDQILVHVKTNPEKWEAASNEAAWNAAGYAAWNATAWNATARNAWHAAWNAAWNATAWNATARNAWHAAWGASMALIAYPDCAYMLNMTPEQIKIYAGLDVRGAVLLLPAVIAMEKEYV